MACSLPVALTICRSVAFRLFHLLGEIISHFEFHILLMWADNRTEQILFSARKLRKQLESEGDVVSGIIVTLSLYTRMTYHITCPGLEHFQNGRQIIIRKNNILILRKISFICSFRILQPKMNVFNFLVFLVFFFIYWFFWLKVILF